MKCVVVTPEKTVVDREVQFVVTPLFDGEFGIGEKHSAVVGRLGAGEMRLTLDDGSIERWYVEGGFVEVVNDVVSVLTNLASPADALDVNEARKALENALNSVSTADDVRIARARLRVAEKAGAH